MPAHAHRAYVDAWMALFEKRLFLAAREVSALAFRLAATEEELARTYNQMGLIELHLRQPEQAGPHFERGLAVVADESITRIKLLNNRAIADFYLGEIDSAWERSQLAYEWCRSTPRVPHALRGDVTWTLGYLALIRQQWERAIDWSRQAVASFNSTGQWLGRAHALNNLGVAEFELDDADNAEKHQREALYAFARLGAAGEAYKAYAYAQLGRIFFARGDLAQTAAFGGQALRALWTHMGLLDKREVGQVCELHGYIAWSGNDRKETISQLQRASTYYLQRHFFQDWARVNQVM
ncbi:MAG TPA: tetratricopeptide repeat protein, partial [Limnochordia bacterium]|nr:tetratricopeptide repeat protein [Limnochordia bacterium]